MWPSLARALSAAFVVCWSLSASDQAGVQFVDGAAELSLRFEHFSGASAEKYMVETFGSGVGWIDFDNDGYLDLYFTNGANLKEASSSPGNALFRNLSGRGFQDVTGAAGVKGNGGFATGVAAGDFDNDGWTDLFVAAFGPDILYRNRGDGTFQDVTAAAGLADNDRWSSSAGFFDYDLDGDLDLYVAAYLDYRLEDHPYCGHRGPGLRMYCHPNLFDGSADQLYRNNGDGTFSDVSRQAGIANPAGKGLGVIFADFDLDGFPDIYVANDAVRNFLYRNQQDGTFQDVAYSAGVGFDPNGKPQAGMGTDAGDVDGDGLFDILVTNFSEELNALYRNQGDFLFEDISARPGLASGFETLGFGTKLLDYDNDGRLDIYVANGHVIDNVQLYSPHLRYVQKDLLYRNTGRGQFQDVSSLSGPAFQIEHVARGTAVADYDNDGDLDIAVSNCGRPAQLFRNEGGNGRHWLLIKAQGTRSNRQGLGTRIRLHTRDGIQMKELTSSGSYLSSNDSRLHFGLGLHPQAERLEIFWPSGARQEITNVKADQILTIREPVN